MTRHETLDAARIAADQDISCIALAEMSDGTQAYICSRVPMSILSANLDRIPEVRMVLESYEVHSDTRTEAETERARIDSMYATAESRRDCAAEYLAAEAAADEALIEWTRTYPDAAEAEWRAVQARRVERAEQAKVADPWNL